MNQYVTLFSKTPIICLVAIAGCGQLGPSNSDIKKELQSRLPAYLEVSSLNVEDRENTGSKAGPNIQGRFKTSLKMKDDTFKKIYKSNLNKTWKPVEDVTYLTPVKRKGESVEFYGLLASEKFEDSWKTSFAFDNNDVPGTIGTPRSSFVGKTVISNSPEEAAYNKEVAAQIKAERNELLASLLNREHQGTWRSGSFYSSHKFKIRLTSGSPDTENITGEITFLPDTVKSFAGTLSHKGLNFTINKVVRGEDTFGTGTVYEVPIEAENIKLEELDGTWRHTDGSEGRITIYLK